MASMAYFKKMREDETRVVYAYGPDSDDMTAELMFDKGSSRPTVDAEDLGYTGRKAAGKILALVRERGQWPEKGASVS